MSTPAENSYLHDNKALLRSFFTRKFRPAKPWHDLEFYCKFLVRCCVYPRVSLSYLNQLINLASLPDIIARQGLMPAKIHRPYLFTSLNVWQRARAIISHYQLLSDLEQPALLRVLEARNAMTLVSWQGKNNELISLAIRTAQFDREGELMLDMYFQQHLITTLTFSLSKIESDNAALCIGGLQGPRTYLNNDIIKEATKACYGLFPKRILLEMACLLAKACGIQRVFAVGDQVHVLRGKRYIRSKKGKLHASYSEFWESIGAELTDQGVYTFDIDLERKSLEDIASKKRAEYRRRYQLLDDLQQQLNQVIGRHDESEDAAA